MPEMTAMVASGPGRPLEPVVRPVPAPGPTELLIERFPDAEVVGLDSSPDMLAQARTRLPNNTFVAGDLATWVPQEPTDLLFGNAVFQWVPAHTRLLQR